MSKVKSIGDKIRINQSIIHNKTLPPIERKKAYLKLKSLRSALKPGGIVKAKNTKISDIYDVASDVHHLIINEKNVDNSFSTNTISHTRFRPKTDNYYSSSLGSNVHLVKKQFFRRNEKITINNVYESSLNGTLSESDFNYIKNNSK